jgi:phosphoribosylformylglycinamidine synthase
MAARAGIILSAHDVSEGGLAVAIAEACMNPDGPVGAAIEVDPKGLRSDDLLFGEAQSRIVVSLKPGDLEALKAAAKEAGAPISVIGRVGGDTLKINSLIELPVKRFADEWKGALEGYLRS